MFPRRTAGKWTPLSAGGWNAAMEAAEDFLERRRTAGEAARFDAGLNRTVIQVRNATGSAMQRGYILGLGDWSFDPDDGQQLEELQETLCVEGVAPVAGTHEDQFVVLPADLADGEIGEAILTGLVLVTVDISDAAHKFCTIDDAVVANLKSATSGRGRILKAQDGTGTKWCLVELRAEAAATEIHRGVTNATLTKGSSATVSRYTDGTDDYSGTDDTVNSDFLTVASGKVVMYVKLGSNFYLLQSEKTSVTVLEDMRIKSDDTAIEAQGQTVFVDTVGAAAYSNKIDLTSCP